MEILILLILFVILAIAGVQAFLIGEIFLGIFCLFPLVVLLCVYPYYKHYYKPRKDSIEALYKMHYLPQRYIGNDYGAWEKKFQEVIAKAIESTSDTAKRSDLKQCQIVIKNMNKSCVGAYTYLSPFSKINEAFRLTGCHLTITDSQGKIITKII